MFKSQDPELSYIEVDNMITSDLTEFTFGTWFKISSGLSTYHLLSHRRGDITGKLAIYLKAGDEEHTPVERVKIQLLQDVKK